MFNQWQYDVHIIFYVVSIIKIKILFVTFVHIFICVFYVLYVSQEHNIAWKQYYLPVISIRSRYTSPIGRGNSLFKNFSLATFITVNLHIGTYSNLKHYSLSRVEKLKQAPVFQECSWQRQLSKLEPYEQYFD